MLMGFIGTPPPAPSSPEESPQDSGDDTGIRLSAARAAASRFRRPRSTLGRYAWAMSLGIHGIVLAGALLAFKYYFHPSPAPKRDTNAGQPVGIGSVVTSDDATDLVHGGLGVTPIPQSPLLDTDFDSRDVKALLRQEPKTVATLSNLSPISGIDSLDIGADSLRASAFSRFPAHHPSPATQPDSNTAK